MLPLANRIVLVASINLKSMSNNTKHPIIIKQNEIKMKSMFHMEHKI